MKVQYSVTRFSGFNRIIQSILPSFSDDQLCLQILRISEDICSFALLAGTPQSESCLEQFILKILARC